MFLRNKKAACGIILILAALVWGCTQPEDPSPEVWDVRAQTTEHGEITPSPARAEQGALITLKVRPDGGYALKAGSLKVNGGAVALSGSGETYTFTMPNADAEVAVEFEELPPGVYTVGTGQALNGTISPDSESAAAGATVTFIVLASPGHSLKAGSVRVNNGAVALRSSGFTYTFTMPASNVTITAAFEAMPYSISAEGIVNGSVTARVGDDEATSAVIGQTVTLIITPDEDYKHTSDSLRVQAGRDLVTTEPAGDGSYAFTMPASDVTVSAGFELLVPPLILTADLGFPAEPNNAFGVDRIDWQGEGAAQTWTLRAGEEPTVYFAVSKGAGQTITLGGTDADSVREVRTAGETPEGFAVPALDDTMAVYAVDAAELIFDGDFEGGTPERVFTLGVAEPGFEGISYTVSLRPSLDAYATASIYRRTDNRWLKIRDPRISAENVSYSIGGGSPSSGAKGLSHIIYANAPVGDLEAAFAWVCYNAESGIGQNTVSGTTAGYSEYRVFLKADQQIGPVKVRYPETVSHVSLELYGAGAPGGAERTITRNTQWNNKGLYTMTNGIGDSGSGLITTTGQGIFILGKNICLSGNNEKLYSDYDIQAGICSLLDIAWSNLVIMKDHAKITGYNSSANAYYTPIFISASVEGAMFYMEGGEISGNTFHENLGVASRNYNIPNFFYKTGGLITGNTRDRVVLYGANNEVDISVPPPGWGG